MFVNDLLLFSNGDITVVNTLKFYLDRFLAFSGLHANLLKSDCFISCLDETLRKELYSLLGFKMGMLLNRYLGICLITIKLSYGECCPILNKVEVGGSMEELALSFGGPLQLVQYVLSTFHIVGLCYLFYLSR